MKFYLAPMEGITGHVYRNTHSELFEEMDKYFTPFIAANIKGKYSTKEWRDIRPEHNEGKVIIPQILTNKSDEFIATAQSLKELGYDEVNLNLGCPSGTVVSKNRGSGFLSQRDDLDRFLETIFKALDMKISIKTRIGKESPEEFEALMPIFNRYPMEELIIHPRIQKDYYKNTPRMPIFIEALKDATMPVCYNGDIFTYKQYNELMMQCPSLDKIMLGRGVIANPGLHHEILTGEPITKEKLKIFHDHLFKGYQESLGDTRHVLFRMKEAWFYISYLFKDHHKHVKHIRKSQHLTDYAAAVNRLFEERDLLPGAGLFTIPE